jgi:hypothetical protein
MFSKLIRYLPDSDCDVDGQRVIQNRVLRRLQEPRTKQQIRQWRKVHDDNLHNLHFSPRVIKLRMMWAGNVACIGETKFWETSLKERAHLQDHLCLDGKIILTDLKETKCEGVNQFI